ncbi:MAG: MBL fold metallo-hydrolase [Theionarchaea archaeon]|nr:MBL fold metallo-hydrolase [Theionarchaea archaeon]MBU6999373.1 MBL fold metallo-hydrolase [Theionarchaea archaeon]MBU7021361.1 MBL fold metallo-hydrolase [Theionarchaea archaeon]
MAASKRTMVILLGTGTPNADPERSGPSVALKVDEEVYLFDFGPGIVRRAAAAGLDMCQLDKGFLTHLHSDHTTGYPDIIFTPWVLGRRTPLEVYGPPGTRAMTDHILAAYEDDTVERVQGLEPANPTGYHVCVHTIQPGIIYTDANIEVEAFRVDHGSLDAFGFKIVTSDRTIVISGDTAPTTTLVEKARGCDVLIHEVYSVTGLKTRPLLWQNYHTTVHTSSYELASIASETAPGLLVLYHQLFWGVSEDQLLTEITSAYEGKVISGKDLDVF